MNFVCPRCESHRLEEILLGVVQATEVDNITDHNGDPCIEYGEISLDDGHVSHFQCLKCGEHIADDEEDLLEWLKERNML